MRNEVNRCSRTGGWSSLAQMQGETKQDSYSASLFFYLHCFVFLGYKQLFLVEQVLNPRQGKMTQRRLNNLLNPNKTKGKEKKSNVLNKESSTKPTQSHCKGSYHDHLAIVEKSETIRNQQTLISVIWSVIALAVRCKNQTKGKKKGSASPESLVDQGDQVPGHRPPIRRFGRRTRRRGRGLRTSSQRKAAEGCYGDELGGETRLSPFLLMLCVSKWVPQSADNPRRFFYVWCRSAET